MFGSTRSFWTKIVLSAGLLLALTVTALFSAASMSAAPAQSPTIQDNSTAVTIGNWYGDKNTHYNGGVARYSDTINDTAQFTFSGTSLKWVTRKGPFDGKANVLIDGISKGTFDLYAATTQYKYSLTFSGLTNKKHTFTIQVVTPNPASTFGEVVVDAFIVGSTTVQENSLQINYDGWADVSNTNASGGSYHVSSSTTAYIYFYNFNATQSYTWITATGPSYGEAQVTIDGFVSYTVDLYSPTQQWKVAKTFSMPAGPSSHTISIHPLGQKNAASTGTKVVVDGFRYQ